MTAPRRTCSPTYLITSLVQMVSASIHKGVCGAHVCMMRTTLLSGLAMCTTPIHQAAVVLLRPGEDHTLAHGLQHALATLSLASAIARILRYVALSFTSTAMMGGQPHR